MRSSSANVAANIGQCYLDAGLWSLRQRRSPRRGRASRGTPIRYWPRIAATKQLHSARLAYLAGCNLSNARCCRLDTRISYKTAESSPAPAPAPAKGSEIDVASFVQENYTPYNGDWSFLAGPTQRTLALWAKLEELCALELKKGILDVDPHVPSTITSFGPGYINKEDEVVVGLQTDAPLKRAIKPMGGINMVKAALEVRQTFAVTVMYPQNRLLIALLMFGVSAG